MMVSVRKPEVELHQPGILRHAFLSNWVTDNALFIAVQRRKVGNFGRRDDHAASTCLPVRDALKATRHIDQPSDLFIRLVKFPAFAVPLQGFLPASCRIGRLNFEIR